MAYEVRLAPNESVERWQFQFPEVTCTNSVEQLKKCITDDKRVLFVCVPTKETYEERFKEYPDKPEYQPEATICTGLVQEVYESDKIIVQTENSVYVIIE